MLRHYFENYRHLVLAQAAQESSKADEFYNNIIDSIIKFTYV
jgi:hypothetical protein